MGNKNIDENRMKGR